MAHGLGLSEEEWLDLKGKIDDSFWVMRVIGECGLLISYVQSQRQVCRISAAVE